MPPVSPTLVRRLGILCLSCLVSLAAGPIAVASTTTALEAGFRTPPPEARPHTYWLWLNGHLHGPSALEELRAMKEAGLSGVLLFEVGARGDAKAFPPGGPAFLSDEWVAQLRPALAEARSLGLQVDMSVISSWDMGGPWIEPRHASMALYTTETTVTGGTSVDAVLPFPTPERIAPLGPDRRPAYWTDVAVLALREPKRRSAHEFVLKLDTEGVSEIREVILDQGQPNAPAALAATMTPVRAFAVDVSETTARDEDFREALRADLAVAPGPQRFALPVGTRARHVRLRLLDGHDAERPRLTLAEFEVIDPTGRNVALAHRAEQSRDGALMVRSPVPLTYNDWSAVRIHDGVRAGPRGVFATAGRPSFDIPDVADVIELTARVDREGRLRWEAPPGEWTILRYVCMITGERLKVPSPASDGLATDHLSAEATRIHMDHVVSRLRAGLGEDLGKSGLSNLYLASYEVVGRVWSPVFADEFQRRRGYSFTRWLPAIFGARVGGEEMTERFLFDYQKTLGEVVVDAYYRTAVEVARAAGLTIKSEAGGPGPPIHTPPIDALLANGAIDNIQGEFWPFWPDNDALNVIKETASAGHIYGKRRVHMEAFTSFHHWAEGPQDLKPSADRVFTEGGNHFVWHTWTHQTPEAGLPGWVYGAGTHLNRSVTWWSKAPAFLSYLSRGSFLLQRGLFVGDVLYYYGDGGSNFVKARRNPPSLGPGYDYDVTNADVILNRLEVRDGRLTLPEGTSYAMLVLPEREDIHPPVLERIEQLVRAGATVMGPRPTRASGLEGFPRSDARVRELADRLWADLDGRTRTTRKHGAGRVIHGRTERDVLAEMGLAPDFVAPAEFDFIHRREDGADIYFVRNRGAGRAQGVARFRVPSGAPEFWDPLTGSIRPVTGFRSTGEGVEVPLELAAHGSTFVVFRDRVSTPSPVAGAPAGVLPEALSLDEDWKVTFASPVGAPPPLALPRVGPWTAQGAPDYTYFEGAAKYRRVVTLPAGWRSRSPRVSLELGRLWSIGEVWVNGTPLGVVWTPPFSVDCTEALRDGENEIVVEVVGTWHNRLIGEARGEVARRTSTNIQVSQRKPWKDLEPVEAGLFGPVRLVPQR